MNQHIEPHHNTTPFDAIRQHHPDGTEYWSARDLAPLMGYEKWQNFDTAVIRRAKAAAENQNVDVTSAFTESSNRVPAGTGSTVKKDYHLSRFAAYLTAMNGDPNKKEVAAAQAYFAIQTHIAETRPTIDAASITRMELLQMAMNAEHERLELEARTKELEPKADAYDSFMDSTGKYSVGAVAQMLGMGQNKLFQQLRNHKVLIAAGPRRNTPYQHYLHHFEVIPHEIEKKNGDTVCTYTTYVQPSGINFIRKKLNLTT